MSIIEEIETIQNQIKERLYEKFQIVDKEEFETLLNNFKAKDTTDKSKSLGCLYFKTFKDTVSKSTTEVFPNEYEMLSNTLRDIINDANKQNTQRYF
ncbi:hypothetical protein A0H76_1916 [Hepatospora eriocheir]|uniref:Uncharacterized protein n=1 Tax=Hepatospora eriocheir TaxID=1081669 RepID=A0A1X0QGK1_9MICR|nr:hypothetical protein HERIO_496 [Hepatospora eriocheir]ORD98794.1 hypothetical protein A0H76_1916 [Hepatospora eriocheir]